MAEAVPFPAWARIVNDSCRLASAGLRVREPRRCTGNAEVRRFDQDDIL